ncbi:MAG: chemotaxis protein CheW [Salinivirgaceae bacterium]|nr:MAG: chemotaxis protein CheW [Salinivirgaceae bacterium]
MNSYLTFGVGAESFAIEVSHVERIIKYSRLTEVPHLPSYILGVLNMNGKPHMVFDSRKKLGVAEKEISDNSYIVILELLIDDKESKVGLLVDDVDEVIEIEESEIKPSPSIGTKYKSDVINGVFSQGDKFIMHINMTKFINTSEVLANNRELIAS